jgi:hypothetical protein
MREEEISAGGSQNIGPDSLPCFQEGAVTSSSFTPSNITVTGTVAPKQSPPVKKPTKRLGHMEVNKLLL